jgi:hypothetical protein
MPHYQWFDLYAWCTSVPIAVRGAFDYKLKNIGRALHELGHIGTVWPKEMKSGLDYSTWIWEASRTETDFWDSSNGGDLLRYNELDVSVMYEVMKWATLRVRLADPNAP